MLSLRLKQISFYVHSRAYFTIYRYDYFVQYNIFYIVLHVIQRNIKVFRQAFEYFHQPLNIRSFVIKTDHVKNEQVSEYFREFSSTLKISK